MPEIGVTIGEPQWSPADSLEDIMRNARHAEQVVAFVNAKAADMLAHIPSDNFEVYAAGGPQRYRAYIRPTNLHGYFEERKHSYILKALAQMVGR